PERVLTVIDQPVGAGAARQPGGLVQRLVGVRRGRDDHPGHVGQQQGHGAVGLLQHDAGGARIDRLGVVEVDQGALPDLAGRLGKVSPPEYFSLPPRLIAAAAWVPVAAEPAGAGLVFEELVLLLLLPPPQAATNAAPSPTAPSTPPRSATRRVTRRPHKGRSP